jgi:hypothetical protein
MICALACSGSPAAAMLARAGAEGSATAATATWPEPETARGWVRPMRPAPTSPSRNGAMSQASRGKVRAVVALILRGPREALRGAGQDVLLDHQPAMEADAVQAVQDGAGV